MLGCILSCDLCFGMVSFPFVSFMCFCFCSILGSDLGFCVMSLPFASFVCFCLCSILGGDLGFRMMGLPFIHPRAEFIGVTVPWPKLVRGRGCCIPFTPFVCLCLCLCSILGSNLGFSMMAGIEIRDPYCPNNIASYGSRRTLGWSR